MILYHTDKLNDIEKQQVKALLFECQDEFVPPLSSRSGTNKPLQIQEGEEVGFETYFKAMAKQHFVLAYDEELEDSEFGGHKLLGFLTYIPKTSVSFFHEEAAYISTVCTTASARGKGVAKAMYAHVGSILHNTDITLKTWSTNYAQINMLPKLGYTMYQQVDHDRGQDIHTVYFCRHVD